MGIPERLITIRSYDSPELAAEDHRALVDEGFDAYLSVSAFRAGGIAELRVPESQVDEALEVLPEEPVPTLQQLTRPSAQCRACGGSVELRAPALAGYVLFGGIGMAVLSLFRGDTRAAFVIVLTSVAISVFLRNVTGRRLCGQCGSEWHPHAHDDEL